LHRSRACYRVDDDWSQYQHVTDGGILDQILKINGILKDRVKIHARVKKRFVSETKRHFSHCPESVKEIPGAKNLIERLRSNDSCALAIATGGWDETARLKLRGIGIELDGLVLATGSDAISRIEIMRIAESRALDGITVQNRTYFGDRIWDKQASEHLGYNFIAVGDEIEHQTAFRDLRPHAAIFRQLGL